VQEFGLELALVLEWWGLELVLIVGVCVGYSKLRFPSECVFVDFLSFHLLME
jgi:hypothetical protein